MAKDKPQKQVRRGLTKAQLAKRPSKVRPKSTGNYDHTPGESTN